MPRTQTLILTLEYCEPIERVLNSGVYVLPRWERCSKWGRGPSEPSTLDMTFSQTKRWLILQWDCALHAPPRRSLLILNCKTFALTQRCPTIKRALKKCSCSQEEIDSWPPCCAQVAVKTEPDYGLKGSMLRHEGEMLVQLQGCPGIPDVHWIGGRELAGVVSSHELRALHLQPGGTF
jgi:hypothetical protein